MYIVRCPVVMKIDKVAKERQINIIFAVTGHGTLYQELQKLIRTSSYGFLDDGSSNLLNLVEDQYQVSPACSKSHNGGFFLKHLVTPDIAEIRMKLFSN